MTYRQRLCQFIYAMSVVALCYYLSGQAQWWFQLTPTLITPTWLDKHIAFNPVGSWVYVSFWVLILDLSSYKKIQINQLSNFLNSKSPP